MSQIEATPCANCEDFQCCVNEGHCLDEEAPIRLVREQLDTARKELAERDSTVAALRDALTLDYKWKIHFDKDGPDCSDQFLKEHGWDGRCSPEEFIFYKMKAAITNTAATTAAWKAKVEDAALERAAKICISTECNFFHEDLRAGYLNALVDCDKAIRQLKSKQGVES